MRKALLLTLSMVGVLLFVALTAGVQAEENPSISTWDATNSNLLRDEFTIGEDVRIKAISSKGSYDIILCYPNGTSVTLASGLSGYYEAVYPAAIMTPKHGEYTLYVGSAAVGYHTGSYTVIPEVPLGVAASLMSCFAGLGYKRLRLRQKRS